MHIYLYFLETIQHVGVTDIGSNNESRNCHYNDDYKEDYGDDNDCNQNNRNKDDVDVVWNN